MHTQEALPPIINLVHPHVSSTHAIMQSLSVELGDIPLVTCKEWIKKLELVLLTFTSQDRKQLVRYCYYHQYGFQAHIAIASDKATWFLQSSVGEQHMGLHPSRKPHVGYKTTTEI